MKRPVDRARDRLYILSILTGSILAVLLLLAACSGPGASNMGDMTDNAAAAGAGNSSETVQVSLAPADGSSSDHLAVELTDAAGNPITDATVSLEGNMNHAGMVPVITDGVTDEADGAADGVYQVPFAFTMNGDWIITVSAAMPDGSVEKQDVNVTVTAEGVEVK